MKSWLIPLVVVSVVVTCVLLIGDRARTADPVKPPQWEYRVMHYTDVAKVGGRKDNEASDEQYVEKGLNKLGQDGWELVAVTSSGPGAGNGHLYLKRAKVR